MGGGGGGLTYLWSHGRERGWVDGMGGGGEKKRRADLPSVTATVGECVQAVVEEAVAPGDARDDVPTSVVFAATCVQGLVVAQVIAVLRYVAVTAPGGSPHTARITSPLTQQSVRRSIHPQLVR